MEESIYYSALFDLYSSLLTPKQRSYFEYYYFENLSINEICENEGISKNAISKQLLNVKEKLDDLESKLNLYKRKEMLQKEFENEKDILKRIAKYDNMLL